VWLALAGPGPDDLVTRKLAWPGARDQIRILASWWALRLIDEAL
jgi:hypothetical protein